MQPEKPSKGDLKTFTTELHGKNKAVTSYRKVLTDGKNDVWAIDLVDMGQYAETHKKSTYKYIFMCIDCFTRKAWAVPMTQKDSKTTWAAFQKIMDDANSKPAQVWVDLGGEFWNGIWKDKCEGKNIVLYHTAGVSKSVMVERLNQTIKNKMWSGFTEGRTSDWVDRLHSLIDEYNNDEHSALKMKGEKESNKKSYYVKTINKYLTPNQAWNLNEQEQKVLWNNQYKDSIKYQNSHVLKTVKDIDKNVLQLGDWVRLEVDKGPFGKGFTAKWSPEPYKIVRIEMNEPPLIYVNTEIPQKGKEYHGAYYPNQVKKTTVPFLNRVEDSFGTPFYITRIIKKVGSKVRVALNQGTKAVPHLDVNPQDVNYLR